VLSFGVVAEHRPLAAKAQGCRKASPHDAENDVARMTWEGSCQPGGNIARALLLCWSQPAPALPRIKCGALRALAVSSKKRWPIAPDVTTIAESAYRGFDVIAWHGILAPANTPAPMIAKLHDQIVAALKDPSTRMLLEARAMQAVGETQEHFCSFITQNIVTWKAVATQADVSVK
jgi:tripartite-type tricarboxylate transporter receptor subunit TctC